MTKRMLLDANHQEETRVVVLSGNRLEDFDYETKDKRPLKGNIYLAKVTRVEPSLQAAFVDYGGNRHGFLPFSEIHPDYYRLPVADRQALIAEQRAAQQNDDGGDGEPAEAESDGADAAEGDDATGTRRAHRRGESDDPSEGDPEVEQLETTTSVETLGGDEMEDPSRQQAAFLGRYKIQEVIKRRQVILVQVVKEERGNKGAALTTYLSLAGRYCVLMPNTNKGGGISRKIANTTDRRRLKKVLSELNIPDGMAVIVRTAGSNRTKSEIKRDYEYLLRLWDEIRETTLQSTAPVLIYEEANLIKRAIRDLYTREMDEVLVEGEDGYRAAKAFMRSLMPSHAKKVQKYEDGRIPLFHRYQVEGQIDSIHNPIVQLRSGGYIVINQTEALVAIDVNSGKATRERHIEETALKTNLEAADEVARQLKLRDLAGLIVVDFIDMDAPRNNREVEQRLKDAMRQDRARIQLGRISPFGLLELSRQRLRPSLHETSTEVCRTCGGSGFVRSPNSTALHVLRALEEEGIKRGGGEVVLTLPTTVALYVLNDRRHRLLEIEQRYQFRVRVEVDDRLVAPAYRLERLSTLSEEEVAEEAAEDTSAPAERPQDVEQAQDSAAKSRKRGKRGGRKRRKGAEEDAAERVAEQPDDGEAAQEAAPDESEDVGPDREPEEASAGDSDEEQQAKRRRRRGKRGGRRRARRREDGESLETSPEEMDEEAISASDGSSPETEAPLAASAQSGTESSEDGRHAMSGIEAGDADESAGADAESDDSSPRYAAAEAAGTADVSARRDEATKPAPGEASGGEPQGEGEGAGEARKPAPRRKSTARKKAETTEAVDAAPAKTRRASTKTTQAKSGAKKATTSKSTSARRRTGAAKGADVVEPDSEAPTPPEASATDDATGAGESGPEVGDGKATARARKGAKTQPRGTGTRARPRKPAARKGSGAANPSDEVAAEEARTPASSTEDTPIGENAPTGSDSPRGESTQHGAGRNGSGEARDHSRDETSRDDAGTGEPESDDKPKRRGWWQKLIS